MQQPNTRLYINKLSTSTRDQTVTRPPRNYEQNTTDENASSSTATSTIEFPQLSYFSGLLTRNAPVLVTNYEKKLDDHESQTIEAARNKLKNSYESTRAERQQLKKTLQKQIIECNRKTAELNQLFDDGITDAETGDYISDKQGDRSEYETLLMDLSEDLEEREYLQKQYDRVLQAERTARSSYDLANQKYQTKLGAQKILADFVSTMQKFHGKQVSLLNDKEQENAQDAVDLLAESAEQTQNVQFPEPLESPPGALESRAMTEVLSKCKLRTLKKTNMNGVESLRLPGE